jgi:hypothetical protein
MKIYTSKTVQMTDVVGEYLPVSETSFEYDGPVALAKGDSTAKDAEVQQNQFDQSLMGIFQQQYATQKSQLDFLNSKMQPMINAPTGYSDSDLTAMRTSATDQDSAAYQNAQRSLNATMAANGDTAALPSGVGAQLNAALVNSEAAQKSSDQNAITVQNANLKQSNYWNAINALNGVASEQNPLGYAGAATSGTSAVANVGNTVNAANQSQLLGALGGVVGGAASGLVSGGMGNLGKGLPFFGCWVAASFWGWTSRKTWLVRSWVAVAAPAWFRKFYYAHGEHIARTPARWLFYPLFKVVA